MKIQTGTINSFIAKIPENIKIVLCYGQDMGLITERSHLVARSFLGSEYQSSQIINIFGNVLKEQPEKFDEEAYTVSLFDSDRKVIMLRDVADSITKMLKAYISSPSEDCLVVIQGDDYPPSSSLRKLCEVEKNAATIACYIDNEASLRQLINEFMQENGFTIERDALLYLIGNLGNDRGITRQELNKLLLYKHEIKHISLEDVEESVVNNSSAFLDKFVYSFFNKQIDEAYHYLRILLEDQSAIAIIRILAFHLQRLHQGKAKVNNGENLDLVVKDIKPPIFFLRVNEFKSQLQKWSNEDIRELYIVLLELEIVAKTSKSSGELMLKNTILEYYDRN